MSDLISEIVLSEAKAMGHLFRQAVDAASGIKPASIKFVSDLGIVEFAQPRAWRVDSISARFDLLDEVLTAHGIEVFGGALFLHCASCSSARKRGCQRRPKIAALLTRGRARGRARGRWLASWRLSFPPLDGEEKVKERLDRLDARIVAVLVCELTDHRVRDVSLLCDREPIGMTDFE